MADEACTLRLLTAAEVQSCLCSRTCLSGRLLHPAVRSGQGSCRRAVPDCVTEALALVVDARGGVLQQPCTRVSSVRNRQPYVQEPGGCKGHWSQLEARPPPPVSKYGIGHECMMLPCADL